MQQTISVNGYDLLLQYAGTDPAETHIYLHADEQAANDIYARLVAYVKPRKLPTEAFALISISGVNWNCDFSPWAAEKAFSGGEAFQGGADAYLEVLTNHIVPEVEATLSGAPKSRILAGYSMAGLFALYSAYKTPLFDKIACMSGSLWFDGFVEYTTTHMPVRPPKVIFLSLGDKEAETKNSRLATVDICTRKVEWQLRDAEISVLFKSNEGGHFSNVQKRIADGIWTIMQERGDGRFYSLADLREGIEMGLDIEFFLFHVRYNISWQDFHPYIAVCPDGPVYDYDDTDAILEHRIDGIPLRDLWRQIELYSM